MLIIVFLNEVRGQNDILMIGFFLDSTRVGTYAAAKKIVTLISFGAAAVNLVAAPMIAEFYAQNRKKDLQRMVTIGAHGIFIFTFSISIILIIWGRHVLALFGQEFIVGYRAFVILTLGQIVAGFAGSGLFLMTMTGHQLGAAVIIAMSALLNIALNAILIPFFDIEGAAVAVFLATTLLNISNILFVLKQLQVNPTIFLLWKKQN